MRPLHGRPLRLRSARSDQVAIHVAQSPQGRPYYRATVVAEVTPLLELRASFHQRVFASAAKLSLSAMLVKAAALVVSRSPSWHARPAHGQRAPGGGVSIAWLVPTTLGPVAPEILLHDVEQAAVLSIGEQLQRVSFAAAVHDRADRDAAHAALWVSNQSAYGEARPESAPLASPLLEYGRVSAEPSKLCGRGGTAKWLPITLHCDGRALRPTLAAEFLDSLCMLVETPMEILL